METQSELLVAVEDIKLVGGVVKHTVNVVVLNVNQHTILTQGKEITVSGFNYFNEKDNTTTFYPASRVVSVKVRPKKRADIDQFEETERTQVATESKGRAEKFVPEVRD